MNKNSQKMVRTHIKTCLQIFLDTFLVIAQRANNQMSTSWWMDKQTGALAYNRTPSTLLEKGASDLIYTTMRLNLRIIMLSDGSQTQKNQTFHTIPFIWQSGKRETIGTETWLEDVRGWEPEEEIHYKGTWENFLR